MNVGVRMREAVQFWRCNVGQAVLGSLGVVLGIMGLVSASAVSAGARAELRALADDLGVGLLLLQTTETFDAQLLPRLASALDGQLQQATVWSEAEAALRYGRIDLPAVRALGTDPAYAATLHLELAGGRFLGPADIAQQLRVAVVSESLANTLAPLGSLLGQELEIDGMWRQVVGVVADSDAGAQLFVPLPQEAAPGHAALRFATPAAMQASLELVTQSAARSLDSAATLTLVEPLGALREEQRLSSLVSTVLTVFAVVVLALGGMSITNTMLMSVMNRHGEIGLRRALGATTPEVVLQFLLESALICIAGGLVAVVLGVAVIEWFGAASPWPVSVDAGVVFSACFATAIIALLAGGLPAWRAALVPPAEVLA
jgi:putative ABC transport system permease protein